MRGKEQTKNENGAAAAYHQKGRLAQQCSCVICVSYNFIFSPGRLTFSFLVLRGCVFAGLLWVSFTAFSVHGSKSLLKSQNQILKNLS